MQIGVVFENLGIGGIERSALRVANEFVKDAEVHVFVKNMFIEPSEIYPDFVFYDIATLRDHCLEWLIIHVDSDKFVLPYRSYVRTVNRVSVVCHFANNIQLPHTDLWCVSAWVKFELKSRWNLNGRVLYNPVSVNSSSKKIVAGNRKCYTIGRISRNDIAKIDFDVVVSLILLSRLANVKLKLVGIPGPIAILIRFFGNKSNIDFIDEISLENEVVKFYESIDLLVHGSFAGETFGMVIAEALHSGTAVFMTNALRKGQAPLELLGRNYFVFGFWNLVAGVKKYLKNGLYEPALNTDYLDPGYLANMLRENKGIEVNTEYTRIKFPVHQRLYTLSTNYALKLWYLFLK